jgi:hypothetical protein
MPLLARGISQVAKLQEELNRLSHVKIPGVVKWRYTLGEDWTRDPAIFFWIILTDAAAAGKLSATTSTFRKKVTDRIDFANDWDLHPYFNFRSLSEQAMLKDEVYE